jgi:hypothetical protein
VFLDATARTTGPAARLFIDFVECGRLAVYVSDAIIEEVPPRKLLAGATESPGGSRPRSRSSALHGGQLGLIPDFARKDSRHESFATDIILIGVTDRTRARQSEKGRGLCQTCNHRSKRSSTPSRWSISPILAVYRPCPVKKAAGTQEQLIIRYQNDPLFNIATT